jgi:hypothetical protein
MIIVNKGQNMNESMKDVVSQQISAAIDALSRAKSKLESEEVVLHLNTAASFLHDIQFNILTLKAN